MSSQKLVYFFLITASVIGLIILTVRRISQASCQYDDVYVCTFIRENRDLSQQNLEGISTIDFKNDGELDIKWEKTKEISTLQISKNNEEILHAILSNRYVYIKDYADNKWWREQKNTVANAIVELPFNPEVYIPEIVAKITKESNQFTYIEESACGEEVCYRYQIVNTELNDEEQLFVFFSKDNFKLKSVFEVTADSTKKINIGYSDVTIQEPEEIKIVSSGRNIFLEYTELKDKDEPKNFEYLQQFQKQRMQSEGNSTIPYVDETATDESTLSL